MSSLFLSVLVVVSCYLQLLLLLLLLVVIVIFIVLLVSCYSSCRLHREILSQHSVLPLTVNSHLLLLCKVSLLLPLSFHCHCCFTLPFAVAVDDDVVVVVVVVVLVVDVVAAVDVVSVFCCICCCCCCCGC